LTTSTKNPQELLEAVMGLFSLSDLQVTEGKEKQEAKAKNENSRVRSLESSVLSLPRG
jgi:hypothetical protein